VQSRRTDPTTTTTIMITSVVNMFDEEEADSVVDMFDEEEADSDGFCSRCMREL
jgi:hypothetical protein